jgi:hypothetical protein
MKNTCLFVELLLSLLFTPVGALAQQDRGTPAASGPAAHLQQKSTIHSPLDCCSGITARDPFMPVPISSFRAALDPPGTVSAPTLSASALPVLSCIGAGMAIGGLVSVRLSHRWDK